MKTFTLLGRKGGITKTTLAINIAAGCARAGQRVVLIDADGQGNASSLVGIQPHDALYALIALNHDWDEVLEPVGASFHGDGELWLLSSSDRHRLIEQHVDTAGRIHAARAWLDALEGELR